MQGLTARHRIWKPEVGLGAAEGLEGAEGLLRVRARVVHARLRFLALCIGLFSQALTHHLPLGCR